MASLSQFSAHVRNSNVSRPYLFYVTLTLPPALRSSTADVKKISLYCHAAMTPGINIMTNDNYIEVGIKRRVAYDYDIQNLTLQFYVDSDYEVKDFFDKWMKKIVGNRRNFEYANDYTADVLVVNILSLEKTDDENENKTVYKYLYRNIYPKTIQPIDLNNAANGVTTFTVDLVFETVTAEALPGNSTKEVIPNAAGITNTEILQSYDANRARIISGLANQTALI